MASSSPDAGYNQSSDGDENLTSEKEFSAEEGIYEVEKIVGISKQDGKTVYRVRWKGYGPDDDTWEPRDNLLTCEDMVEEFLEKHKEQKKQRKGASEGKKSKQSKSRKPQKRRGPKGYSSSSSYTSSSSLSSSSAFGRSSASSNDEEESSPKIQKTEVVPPEPEAVAETQKEIEEPLGEPSTSQQQQQQPQQPSELSGDERAVLLKDPFWHQLEKGLISFTGDMYSKVKGRRAALDAKKKQEHGDEGRKKSRERRKQKKEKKDRRTHKAKHKKDRKKSKSKINLDLFGSLESATQKTLSMSPSVLDRSENSANLFRRSFLENSEETLTVAQLEEKSRLSSSPSQSDKTQTPSESGSSTTINSSSSQSSSTGVGGSDGESNASSGSTIIAAGIEPSAHEQDADKMDVGKLPSEIAALSTDDSNEHSQESVSTTNQPEHLAGQVDAPMQQETQVSDWSIDRVLATNTQQEEPPSSSHMQNLEQELASKVNLNAEQSQVVASSPTETIAPAQVSHVESMQHERSIVKPPATSPQQYQGTVHPGLYQQQQQRAAPQGVPLHHQQHLSQQQQQQQMFLQQQHQQQVSPQQHHHQQMSPQHQQQMSPIHQQQMSQHQQQQMSQHQQQQMSPQQHHQQQMSPQHHHHQQQMSPQQHHQQQMSPQHHQQQQMSPQQHHQQQMSPQQHHQQQMSPHHPYQQQISPNHYQEQISPHHQQQQQILPHHQQQQQQQQISPTYPVVRPVAKVGPNMGTATQRPAPLQIPPQQQQQQQQQQAQGQYGMEQHQQQMRLDTHAAKLAAEQRRRGSKGSPTSDAIKKSSHSSKESSKHSSKHSSSKDKSHHHRHRHDSSQERKSGHKSKHDYQKKESSNESSQGTLSKTKQHSTTSKCESTGKKEKHPSGHNLTTAPTKTNRKKGVIFISSDEDEFEETTIKDPFWENLYTGKLNFERGDMYSSVKQRRALAECGQAINKVLLEDSPPPKVDDDDDDFEDLRVDKLLDEVEKIAQSGSSDFEFEFEQESPDAGYQSPGKDEMEAPAFVSDGDLQRAVIEGKNNIVRAAFKMNIALNLEQPDSNGATLLMHACINRNEEVLKLLIVQGAAVNACSKNGITPLMYVCEQGFASAAGILLEAGAFVNFKQPATGDTALICSSRRGHAEVVQVLLDYGANWALSNVNNTSAESFARLNNHFAVQDILNTYTKRMTRELEMSVTQYMSGTAELVKPLFPLHCIRVREACEHNIYLYHELNQYSYRQGFGNLLFFGHANMGPGGTNCRLTGPCYVREAFLNGQLLPQLNQGSNFIVSLPLRHGHNLIKIRTIRDPYTNVIVLVGGYSMQVIMP